MPPIDFSDEANSDLIIEDDDPDDLPASAQLDVAPWRILIVDDDVDVHVVTKFALSNTSFQGRRLSFLHAYSGKEALDMLRKTPDIALVLLDVIMETPDAGLRVARLVRDELHNDLVRVVLRTGQPGQALEHSIIVDYDINDFWCKADLTTRKLFTTVIASLRAYATLQAASAQREALDAQLSAARNMQQAVDQHALLLTLDADGKIIDANERLCSTMQVERAALLGKGIEALHPAPLSLATEIVNAIKREGGWAGDIHAAAPDGSPIDARCAVLAFKNADGKPYQYVAVATLLNQAC